VLSHSLHALDWMQACGAEVPKTHGFFALNLLHADRPCAGLDFAPHLIGALGAEIVIAMLHRNERGVPNTYSLTTFPSRWVDGPTVREVRRRAKRR
jgi:LacI family transcriptional regulator